MYERDLSTLQDLAKQGKLKYINITQQGNYAVAEATNGFCYMRISEPNSKPFNGGLFSFSGRFVYEQVQLPQGYEILSSQGKKIGDWIGNEDFNIPIGEKGEFFCTFNRLEILDWLKHYLSGWKTIDKDKYQLVFHRDTEVWRLRGYEGKKVHLKELSADFHDNISDRTFRFTVNPHTFRHILKWFDGNKVKLWFHNGNYECRSAIWFEEENKLAVLMPIARKQ